MSLSRSDWSGQDFEELVSRTMPALMKYCYYLSRDPARSEELAQDTYLRALSALKKGREVRNPVAWLRAVARNLFVDGIRSPDARIQAQVTMVELEQMEFLSTVEPDSRDVELELSLAWALSELDHEAKEAASLVYLEGHGYLEAARILGVPISTVKSRLLRARKTIRGLLDDSAA